MLLAQNKETGKNLRGYSSSWTGETEYGTLYAVRRLMWVPRLVKASVWALTMVFEKRMRFTSVATFFLPIFLKKNSKFRLSSLN
jgi:hypothetical protein